MAKKKRRSSGRRRSYKKKRRSGPKAKPAGLAGGFAYGGAQALFVPAAGAPGSLFEALKEMDVEKLTYRLPYVVKDTNTYKPLLVGMLVSAAPRIPIVGIVAKPADRGLKRLTKGKWGL